MNHKQKKTLNGIFENPVRADIEWENVISLLSYLGVEVIYGKGSRVKFRFNGLLASLDKPHPRKELKRYQVLAIREFLENSGLSQQEQ